MRQIQLNNKLSGMVTAQDFNLIDDNIEIKDGEFLIQNIYCGTDP